MTPDMVRNLGSSIESRERILEKDNLKTRDKSPLLCTDNLSSNLSLVSAYLYPRFTPEAGALPCYVTK